MGVSAKRAQRIKEYGVGSGSMVPIAMPTKYIEDFADRYYTELDYEGTLRDSIGLSGEIMSGLEDYIQNDMADQRRAATETSIELSTLAADRLNEVMADQFYGALDVANPRWREQLSILSEQTLNATQLSKELNDKYASSLATSGLNASQKMFAISESLLSGKIPEDVKQQMTKGMAEQAWASGSTSGLAEGSFGSSLYQNLGLTSLQMMSLGAGFAGQANQNTTQTMQALTSLQGNAYTSAGAMTDVMKSYMPNQVDVSALFSQNMSALAPTASDVFSVFGTTATGAVAAKESNQQQYLSLLSGALARYDSIASGNAAIRAAKQQARIAAKAQTTAATIGAVGSIVGGSMAGAGAFAGA